jgi:hypothetical protein
MCVEEQEASDVGERSLWDAFLDNYLRVVDFVCACFLRVQNKGNSVNLSHPLVEPNSRALVRVTTGALFLVFAIVLCSCASTSRQFSQETPRRKNSTERGQNVQSAQASTKKPMQAPVSSESEYLYAKKERVLIKKKETGSPTGSMWADAGQSRNLFAEDKPQRVGDIVTISIPEDLRYSATAGGAAAASSSAQAPAALGNEKSNASETMVSPGAGTGEPLKEFRMEIVGVESTGDVYLRGVREYRGQNGKRMIAVNAKVPRRILSSSVLDARALTAVTVNEDADGVMADYQTPGWDKVVSRKISGFVPDVNSELASIEDARKELDVQREALRQQTQALQDERERLLKERARMAKSAEQALEQNAEGAETQKTADATTGKSAAKAATAQKEGDKAPPSAKGAAKTKEAKAVGGTTP